MWISQSGGEGRIKDRKFLHLSAKLCSAVLMYCMIVRVGACIGPDFITIAQNPLHYKQIVACFITYPLLKMGYDIV